MLHTFVYHWHILPIHFLELVCQWNTLFQNSLFLGSLNSKAMMVYLMLNNTLTGMYNAYLNVMMKEILETLLLKFSKQMEHDNDRRIRWVIPGSAHGPKQSKISQEFSSSLYFSSHRKKCRKALWLAHRRKIQCLSIYLLIFYSNPWT